jgi:hypothetical protein
MFAGLCGEMSLQVVALVAMHSQTGCSTGTSHGSCLLLLLHGWECLEYSVYVGMGPKIVWGQKEEASLLVTWCVLPHATCGNRGVTLEGRACMWWVGPRLTSKGVCARVDDVVWTECVH